MKRRAKWRGVLAIHFSGGRFEYTKLDVVSPGIDKLSNYIYVSV